MKISKFSLAALTAIGTLSCVNAATLEESLKEVQPSVFERLKIDGFARAKINVKDKDSSDNTIEDIRLSAQLNVLYAASDKLAFGTTLAADKNENPAGAASHPIAGYTASNNKGLYIDRFYLKYMANDFTVIGGKQDIYSPWTETGFNSSRGNGLSALYKGVEEWTFAAAAFSQTNGFDDTNLGAPDIGSHHNLYAAGAIGAFKDIGLDLQLWGGAYEKTIDTALFADIKYQIAGFNIRGQLNYSKLDKDFADNKSYTDDDGIFFGVEAGYKNDLFSVGASYTKNDKKQPVYGLDGDNIGFIKIGSDLYYYMINVRDVQTYYVKGGLYFDKLSFRAGYGVLESGEKGYDGTISEAHAGVHYQYLKDFGVDLTLASLDGGGTGISDSISGTLELFYRF
ncbi:MAG: major outer membrane protein [Campylobacteraceae bacterium]|jgi:hypothetical protein|nr:major outer membrane protein [Campylobacteraceae bacterium]